MNEYGEVCAAVERLGFEHVYIQPDAGDEQFVPDFEQNQPFAGNRRNPVE